MNWAIRTRRRWGGGLDRQERTNVEAIPREVEIELTTDDPYPNSCLRPRGSRVERRGPIDIELVRRVAEELAAYDDSLIVLGGFGDPLRHPEFPSALRAIRAAGEGGSRCVRRGRCARWRRI